MASDISHKDNGTSSPDEKDRHESVDTLENGAAPPYEDPGYTDHRADDDRADEARGRNADKYNKKYWLSVNYIGSLFAVGLAFMGGIGGYGLIAPVLTQINEDIGPSPNINWVPLVNLCGGAIFFLMVGELSDIFGRRWFFIFGSFLALLGSIVGAIAQDVNTLIGAETLIGVAVAFQQSFFWVVSELVPMKYRYLANSYCYLMTVPSSPLAARVAYTFLTYPGAWRNCFYFLIAINGSSMLAWFLFYHPPTFSMLHRKRLARDLLLHFDWIGLILYSGGLAVFIFGINWGGVLYPWNSPQVISTMVVGGVTLFGILPAYEIIISRRGKKPYLPLHLFTNLRYMCAAWNNGTGACVYYGFSLVFPQAVNYLYFGRGQISQYDVGTLAGLVPMCFVFAQIVHGFVEWFMGPKWSTLGAAIIAAALLTAASADLDNLALTQGLIIPGAFMIGLVESISTTTSTFHLRSQEEIGQGGGLCGSIRNFTSAIAVAIYTATLSNRLNVTIPSTVYPVARRMGLSESALKPLAAALQGQGSYSQVPGLTNNIKQAVQEPFREAWKNAASTVFLVSLAFTGTAVVLACFYTNNDPNTQNYVAGGVHGKMEEKDYNKEFQEHRRASQTEMQEGEHAH